MNSVGIYKNIKVHVSDFSLDNTKYYIEPTDDDKNGWESLESAGFVEYFMRWYKVVSKDDKELKLK